MTPSSPLCADTRNTNASPTGRRAYREWVGVAPQPQFRSAPPPSPHCPGRSGTIHRRTRTFAISPAGHLLCVLLCAALSAPVHAQDPPAAEPPPAGVTDIRQVQVQVWISETNEQGLRDLGANLYYNRFVRGEEQSGAVQQVSTNLLDLSREFPRVTLPAPTSNAPSPPFVTPPPPRGTVAPRNPPFAPPLRPDENNNPNDGIQTRAGAGMTFSIINPGYGTIDGVFRALEIKDDVDLISKPELLVVNNSVAEIKAGGQIPYQTIEYPKSAAAAPQLQVAWRDVGVNMKLQPTVLPDDLVQLHVQELEVSDNTRIENFRGVDLPVFSKRSQTGFVYVPTGQTLVIGGLSSRVVRKTERRVPIVGRLPLVGVPFRSRRSEADIIHLLIFVSPTVVDLRNMSPGAFSAVNFWKQRKNEWANAATIAAEVESMQSEL